MQEYVNKIQHCDCLKFMQKLPSQSIDMILVDPPYNLGIDTWDNFKEIPKFFEQSNRILKDESWFIFFGQMPTVIDWINEAKKYFNYREHISWIKRVAVANHNLNRTHEDIFIYSKKRPKFLNTKGKYTDIKTEGLFFSIYDIESIKRHIDSLRYEIKNKKTQMIKPGTRSNKIYKRYLLKNRVRAPEYCNYTNVWSFLPEWKSNINNYINHPTIKPLRLLNRLIDMLTTKDMIIADFFLGSGSTAVACEKLDRRWIGCEISQEYCKIAETRIRAERSQGKLNLV